MLITIDMMYWFHDYSAQDFSDVDYSARGSMIRPRTDRPLDYTTPGLFGPGPLGPEDNIGRLFKYHCGIVVHEVSRRSTGLPKTANVC